MDRKYPANFFWTQLLFSLFVHHIYLCLPGLTLLIVGIWIHPCLYVGICLLVLDAALSLASALKSRYVVLTSDNPNFCEAQDALMSENWRENLQRLVDKNTKGENQT